MIVIALQRLWAQPENTRDTTAYYLGQHLNAGDPLPAPLLLPCIPPALPIAPAWLQAVCVPASQCSLSRNEPPAPPSCALMLHIPRDHALIYGLSWRCRFRVRLMELGCEQLGGEQAIRPDTSHFPD